jgi:hypothetical protein
MFTLAALEEFDSRARLFLRKFKQTSIATLLFSQDSHAIYLLSALNLSSGRANAALLFISPLFPLRRILIRLRDEGLAFSSCLCERASAERIQFCWVAA